jgi:cell division protein FtsI/penicillin-binding protein 2
MTMVRPWSRNLVALWMLVMVPCGLVWAQDKVIARASSEPAAVEEPAPAKTIASTRAGAPVKPSTKKTAGPPFATYGDPAEGDDPSRDDPVVRAAAVKALGKIMGSVVVVDPDNGRVLSVVNQELAFGGGYQPCSAFKPAVALAALSERIIESDRTRLQLGKKWYLDLHKALALSNNLYFEKLGRTLGIDKLERYAHEFGFGEQAGWGIEPEPAGVFPSTPPPAKAGGVGKVASFGEGISMTLFQLASFVSALANGGTLYYLQYPAAGQEQEFTPRVKRQLPIGTDLAVVQAGMEEAVLTGTARRAKQPDLRVVGKTGTCSEGRARLGWFAGYNREPGGVAIVVLLRTGQRLGGGPKASEVAGAVFRQLNDANYYTRSIWRPAAQSLPASIQMPGIQ